MNKCPLEIMIVWFLAALLGVSHAGFAQVTVQLFDVVCSDRESVVLGDVALLEGDPQATERIRALLIRRDLDPGGSVILTSQELMALLPYDAAAFFKGASAVEIVTPRYPDVQRAITRAIQRRYEDMAGDSIQVRVELKPSDQCAEISPWYIGQYSILTNGLLYAGSQVVTIECHRSDGVLNRLHVSVDVTLLARLAISKSLIKRGQVIGLEDVEIVTLDLNSVGQSGLVLHPDCMIGLEASRHIAPNSPIRWDQLRQPSLVHKGKAVEVELRSEYFLVTAQATALENGSLGDEIWIRLGENRKRLRAVVVDTDRVSLQ